MKGNFGIRIQNVKAKDGKTGVVSMGNSFIVMPENDYCIWVENTEGLTITECKFAMVSPLRFWLIRKLCRMGKV